MPYREVCTNGMLGIVQEGQRSVSIRHTPSAPARLREVSKMLGIIQNQIASTEATYVDMTKISITKKNAARLFERLIPDNPTAKNKSRTRNQREDLMDSFEGGIGSKLAGNTLWGWFNAVTDWTDHRRFDNSKSKRSPEETAERRFKSILDGNGFDYKKKAIQIVSDTMDVEGKVLTATLN